MPVFEGLLPEQHDNDILSLLFTAAEWHTLAKLRLHTESTLDLLEQTTTQLGTQLRRFQSYTCSFFVTRELPKEEAARGRRQARKKPTPMAPAQSGSGGPPSRATRGRVGSTRARGRGVGRGRGQQLDQQLVNDGASNTENPDLGPAEASSRGRVAPARARGHGHGTGRGRGQGQQLPGLTVPPTNDDTSNAEIPNPAPAEEPNLTSKPAKPRKLKTFSLLTYKLHALGDYVRTIRWFGTSDSYSTQPVRYTISLDSINDTYFPHRENLNIVG